MDEFIRSLSRPIGCFIRRTYSVMLPSYYRAAFSIVNIDNNPAILISTEQSVKIYYPTNLYYHFSSTPYKATLAYKDDKLWICEERYSDGQTICQVGLGVPPNLAWQKFKT